MFKFLLMYLLRIFTSCCFIIFERYKIKMFVKMLLEQVLNVALKSSVQSLRFLCSSDSLTKDERDEFSNKQESIYKNLSGMVF